MLEMLARAHIEERRREIAAYARGMEAVRFARLSETRSVNWLSRLTRRGQLASRASSAAFAPGHSASTSE